MKMVRASEGPFPEYPFFEGDEIEQTCVQELRRYGLYPEDPRPIRIDRFIEKRFNLTPSFEALPIDLLGYTKFGAKGVEGIVVYRKLDEEGGHVNQRRLNTTLAHEAGHGVLHEFLYVVAAQQLSLYEQSGSDLEGRRILCRNENSVSKVRPKAVWWEYQANRAMASFLLPRELVKFTLYSMLETDRRTGDRVLPISKFSHAEKWVSSVFDVNPVVARIRIGEIFSGRKMN